MSWFSNTSSAPRQSWTQRLGTRVRSELGDMLELLAGAASLVGIPLAVILGKLFLAAVLAALVLGIGLRFARRRRLPGHMRASAPLDSPKK
jgi:uncharacterized membrane protein YfcA